MTDRTKARVMSEEDRLPEKIAEFAEALGRAIAAHNLQIIERKRINYGLQLVIGYQEPRLPVNVYWTPKNGLKAVPGGSKDNILKPVLEEIIPTLFDSNPAIRIHSWQSWLGTDEAGKGDFYGALVVAGFHADRDVLPLLKEMGVRDSKLIPKREIESIAHDLYKRFNERIGTVVLKPESYNKLYLDFRQQGKKLNELMAWMHGRVIIDLLQRRGEKRVLIDKFTTDKKLLQSLKELQKVELLQVPRAEADPAVAAASIIARYHYLVSLKQLSSKYKIPFKSGSGAESIKTGVTFAGQYSLARMKEVAKIHFNNYTKIRDEIKENGGSL